MQIITSTKEENEVLSRLDKRISEACYLTQCEKEFINSMILRKKPKKVLEVGVAAGGSSGIILNAINKLNNGAELYSVDFSTAFCNDSTKLSGYATLDYASDDLKKNWHLLTGNFVSEFMDEIGNSIDFVFIDTVHWNPGEIIDFLMVLPYLKESATVLFHDIHLHGCVDCIEMTTNCILMSAVKGEKLLPSRSLRRFVNIGGIVLDKNIKDNLWDIFNCLNMPWSYVPTIQQVETIKKYFKKHYGDYLCNLFENNYMYYIETGLLNKFSTSDKRYSKKSYIIAEEDMQKKTFSMKHAKENYNKLRKLINVMHIIHS